MKVRKLIALFLLVALVSLSLVGCASTNKEFKESDLESFTVSRTYNDETYTVEKNGVNYKETTVDGEVHYYKNYNTVTFEYTDETFDQEITSETSTSAEFAYRTISLTSSTYVQSKYYVVKEAEEGSESTEVEYVLCDDEEYNSSYTYYNKVELVHYVASNSSDSTIAEFYTSLINLDEGAASNTEDNPLVAILLEGIYLDDSEKTEGRSAYESGFLTVSSVALEKDGNAPKTVTISLTYASKSLSIVYNYTKVNSTTFDTLNEDTTNLTYNNYLSDSNPTVTLTFEGYGSITLQLFVTDYDDSNVANYFLYCLKEKFYKKAAVDLSSTLKNGITFGSTEKKITKTVSVDSDLALKNTRGLLSMVVISDSTNTSQLILNTSTNTTYDTSAYTPVAGVVDGFEVLDSLTGLSEDIIKGVSVKISVKYNGYKYSAPTFA
ncbi:MAG: peptidylprolyl isomerase [Gammaproteobacteria bacterium]|nr:peptidylprolyl isomerase [Gammaproteobacteria bacterium]